MTRATPIDRLINCTFMTKGTAAIAAAFLLFPAASSWAQDAGPPAGAGGVEGVAAEANNGTDPRDFGNKLMPYYRFTHLRNGAEDFSLTLFGMFDLSPLTGGFPLAFTYEVPVVQHRDITGALPPIGGAGFSGNTLPLDSPEETGIGDLNIRVFAPVARAGKFNFLLGGDFNFPTATEDLLGTEKYTFSPIIVPMYAGGPNWFIAPMIFPYKFDYAGDDGRADIEQTMCRCFAMYAWQSGWYLLPELQPIWDWQQDEFSLYVMPEVGKILSPGTIAYFKPGFGIDPDENEREAGLEVGVRIFF